jgi:HlyD family secretion protein
MLIKFNFLLKHKKKIIVFSIILIAIIIVFLFISNKSSRKVSNVIRQESEIKRDDITVSITGSGAIASSSKKNIATEVSANVLSSKHKVGDKVSKGDVLFNLDDSDLSAKIRNQQKTVSSLQKSVNELAEDMKNLNVYSTSSGYVSGLKYSVGDTVNKNSVLFSLTDSSKYKITCDFVYNEQTDIEVGDSANLFLYDSFNNLTGTVTFVSGIKNTSTLGGQTQSVEIEVSNPGYSLVGINAIATVHTKTKDIKSQDSSVFDSGSTISFKSPSSGTITALNIRDGSYVSEKSLIIVLENEDLITELSDAKTNLNNAYEDLADIKDDIGFYTITSPIDGIITEIDVNEGDYVREESTLAKIVNNYDLEFNIDVDELDISKIKVGQEVIVTIDALNSTKLNPIKGTITEIAVEGTSQNDVTSYPVKISLQGNDEIKIGMNANAEIIIEKKENILVAPVEAINTRKNKSYVTLKDGTQSEVTVGIYNEDKIEIVSGLSEGDVVLLPEIKIQNNNGKINMNTMRMNSVQGGQVQGTTFKTESSSSFRVGGSR